jgi:hypothetical protein
MPLFMDVHKVDGATDAAVAEAHMADLKTQEQYGVKYLKYCPSAEEAVRVHKEAHGLVADEIFEVKEYS